DRHRSAEAFVAGPAEMDGVVLAGLLGDWGEAGEGSDGFGAVVGWSAVAPLGEHLGCVDLTRPWQRGEDLVVRVLTEVGDDGAGEGLDRGLERSDHPDIVDDGVATCVALGPGGQTGGSGSKPLEEFSGGAPTGVAVLGQEGGQALLAEASSGR